jgi:hypothetical protein
MFEVEQYPCWICPPSSPVKQYRTKKPPCPIRQAQGLKHADRYRKRVVRCDSEGRMIGEPYESITAAAAANNISIGHISRALRGIKPSAAGYKWRYA